MASESFAADSSVCGEGSCDRESEYDNVLHKLSVLFDMQSTARALRRFEKRAEK